MSRYIAIRGQDLGSARALRWAEGAHVYYLDMSDDLAELCAAMWAEYGEGSGIRVVDAEDGHTECEWDLSEVPAEEVQP